MCEYVKYKLKPSDLSNLLGAWGPWRQFEAIAGLLKETLQYDTYAHTKFLVDHGLVAHWAKLQNDATRCETQDQISSLTELASQTLLSCVSAPANTDLDSDPMDDPVLLKARELRNSLASKAQRAYGKNNERRFIAHFNKCAGPAKQIHSPQLEVFRYLTKEPITCAIVGKIDGLMGTELVEIKHRRHLLFDELPPYELLQLHAYMFAAGKLTCKVIQCVRRQDMEATDMIQVHFDENFWANTMQKLQRVIAFAEQLGASNLAWDAFKSCSMEHKERMMNAHIY